LSEEETYISQFSSCSPPLEYYISFPSSLNIITLFFDARFFHYFPSEGFTIFSLLSLPEGYYGFLLPLPSVDMP
jgi:hypothetical protein